MWLIPHIQYDDDVVKFSRSSVTVIKDLVVLLLYDFKCFNGLGLLNLYLLKSQEDNEKMPPVHKVYANLYDNYCIVLLSAHLGTGADYIYEKNGTKKSAAFMQIRR